MPSDNNDKWGRDALVAENMLYVYASKKDPRLAGKDAIDPSAPLRDDPDRLFTHDVCFGQRYTYTAKHVNQLLVADTNPDGIKERIVTLIPMLSAQKKRLLADGISEEALAVVKSISEPTADMLKRMQHRGESATR